MKQKLGISLIAAWYALGGVMILLIAAGIGFGADAIGIPAAIATMGAMFVGAIALISFALAYGIYNLEAWGWYIVMALSVLGVVSALISLNICSLIIPAIILWYLWDNQRDFGVRIQV